MESSSTTTTNVNTRAMRGWQRFTAPNTNTSTSIDMSKTVTSLSCALVESPRETMGLNSRPINDIDSDAGSDFYAGNQPASPGCYPANGHATPFQYTHPALVPNPEYMTHSISTGQLQRSATTGKAIIPIPSQQNGYELQAHHPERHSVAAKFRSDLMTARTGTNAMDRYKALTRMFNSLKREMAAGGLEQPFKVALWVPAHHELLWRIVEVGESLASFGTADFGERSNSSRAINTKDYAYLLKLYGEMFWGLYRQEFMEGLPQVMQDDMASVRGLLTTRFEANAIIQDQLIKHVGLETQGGGGQGAVVYNTSVVSANPTNTVSHNPISTIQTYAAAASKALQQGHTKMGAIALGSLAGLLLVKRTGLLGFIPGMGRPRRRARDVSETEDGHGRRRGRSGRGISPDERLLLAFDHVDRSYKELMKAQRNVELLKQDWRLGPVRLAAPLGGPDPPGFEPLDVGACEPRQFMHTQLSY